MSDFYGQLNWGRILLYVVFIIGATFIGGFIPGVIKGVYSASGDIAPSWVAVLQGILVPLFALVVYVRFARIQRDRLMAHVIAIWGLSSAASLLNLLLGLSVGLWAGGVIFSAIIALAGAGIGAKMRP